MRCDGGRSENEKQTWSAQLTDHERRVMRLVDPLDVIELMKRHTYSPKSAIGGVSTFPVCFSRLDRIILKILHPPA
jgi:hypothetical protein